MRAFWVTWMWFCRGLMASSVAMLGWNIGTGHPWLAVVNAVSLVINAGTAEFSRRQVGR